MTPAPRSPRQRRRDTLRRLDRDTDVWVATADSSGRPYLVPLSFLWDDATLLVATPASSRTARNLADTGRARLGLGPSRDVVVIDATAQTQAIGDLAPGLGDAFAARTGFDPRQLDGYVYVRLSPVRVQAWREVDELAGRDLLRDRRWLADEDTDGEPAGRSDADAAADDRTVPVHAGGIDELRPIGWIVSSLLDPAEAPRQGDEGAPPARIMLRPEVTSAAADLSIGDRVVVVTWLHGARRDVLAVHPRDDASRPREGVFSTRSANRPNPIGLHETTITDIGPGTIAVDRLEAIDGTPVLDVKPVLGAPAAR
jgi:tRNA-Thr(GGU) m(6)t(6)A37 methyltransferase TsaA